jgi:NAD(P)-dependent dehydrogenase (short-subunit alcohol dehydrogenase family)
MRAAQSAHYCALPVRYRCFEARRTLEAALASSPLHRIGDPEDIAGVALLLGSDAGRFITGTTIVVDGGATVRGND